MTSKHIHYNFGFLTSIGVIYLTADSLHIKSVVFQLLNYFVLIFFSIKYSNFSKFNFTCYIILLLSIIIPTSHAFFTDFDIFILIKYCLLFFIVFSSMVPRKSLSIQPNYLFLIPWILLIFLGLAQLIWLFLNPLLVLVKEHSRPVGFSVEPTFFSQQLVMLWLLSVVFCKAYTVRFFPILEVLTVVLIIACATRTSMLLACPIIIYRLFPLNGIKIAFLMVCFPTIFYFMSNTDLSAINIFLMKIERLFTFSGEPREIAFIEMLDLISNNGFFGAGFLSIESSVGLMLGSLYGNITLALFYTFGVLIIFPLFGFLTNIFASGLSAKTSIYLYILLLSQVMPFFFTAFGLFCWIISASASYQFKKEI